MLQTFLRLFSIILIAFFANYWLLIPAVIVIILLMLFRYYFLRTSRNIQRLEGIGKTIGYHSYVHCTHISLYTARSPLYSHISATIHGLSTIRAYKEEGKFIDKFHLYQNEHTKCWYIKITSFRWFGMRIDTIGSLFLISVIFSSIALAESKFSFTYIVISNSIFSPQGLIQL